ncbi:hypothetical protein FQN57_003835 [Myotisia sp. PD_48]|nr:hypothetical protein FQN57_003835 [Myotisia sp. PD_48]
MSQNDRAIHLRKLHKKGDPLIFCNVYDGRTARIVLEHKGRQSKALATSSFAVAAVRGKDDEEIEPEMLVSAAQDIVSVIDRVSATSLSADPIPLSIDMLDGFGEKLEDIVSSLISVGVVGCNMEDEDAKTSQLMSIPDAADRVRRVMAQATALGVPDFVINARTDVLGHGGTINDAIERGKAYMEAGAFSVFVWGGRGGRTVSRKEVQKLAESFDGFINARLKTGPGYLTVKEMTDLGVRRISLGKELSDIAMDAYQRAIEKILT